MTSGKVIELDVRPYLRQKIEPFQLIMDAVKTVGKDDTFVLHATFKPTPLLTLLKTKGFANKVEQVQADHWKVTFVHDSRKDDLEAEAPPLSEAEAEQKTGPDGDGITYTLDNRGLNPPEPMIRTLKLLERCHAGDQVVIHNDRTPVFLMEELRSLGYSYTTELQPDGTAIVMIRKP